MEKVDLKEMLEAGVHFGHKKDRWNPQMRSFIYTERNGVHIFDLTKTKERLEAAITFVESLTAKGGKILFVGTKNQVKAIVKEAAEKVEMPYLTDRWPGGMLTNFQTIVKRLKYLEELEEKIANEGSGLTKKEKVDIKKEITKLSEVFGGVKDMRKLPEAIFVSDIVKERIAIREAKKAGIPVIGVADSNATPDIEYVIPGNDDAVKSIQYIVSKITSAVTKPKKIEEDKILKSKVEEQDTDKTKKKQQEEK